MRSIRFSTQLTLLLMLIALMAITTPTADLSQDPNFRLMNVERRLDQLQYRVDAMERFQQTQSLNTTSANITPAAVLELQRQQISLAEQAITMQKQMLEMQKTIDRLAERVGGQEKKPEEKTKPKSLNGKP
jgi:TolA-binding protein